MSKPTKHIYYIHEGTWLHWWRLEQPTPEWRLLSRGYIEGQHDLAAHLLPTLERELKGLSGLVNFHGVEEERVGFNRLVEIVEHLKKGHK